MNVESTDDQDRQAMARLVTGEDEALDELMARHAVRLFHYLIRVLQNETEAADLAEESFVRVYQNRIRFKPQHKFTTWLYAIATNLARDLQRHRARHPHVSLQAEPTDAGHGLQESLPEHKPNPGELLEATERAEAVRRAIADLPEELRVPLLLAEYEEKSYAEIAAILNCSAKAVEMCLYRARHQLRARLERLLAAP
jgi:RNA polymerase sigma-70 factor, ECF subfamily